MTQLSQSVSTRTYLLSDLLPYEAYDKDTQLYVNQHSMGFVLETSLLLGANQETTDIIHSLLTDILPPHFDLQWLVRVESNIQPMLDRYAEVRIHALPTLQTLLDKRLTYYKALAQGGVPGAEKVLMRDFRSYLIVSVSEKSQETQKQLQALRASIITTLHSVHMWASPLKPAAFIQLIRTLLYEQSDIQEQDSVYSHLQYIADQITSIETSIEHTRTHLNINHCDVPLQKHYYHVAQFPKQAALWQSHELLGQLFNETLQIPVPFTISVHLRSLDADKSQTMAQMKYLNKSRAAMSQLARFHPGFKDEQQDWDIVRNRLQSGERLFQVNYQVSVSCEADKFPMVDRKLRDLYKANGWRLEKAIYLQLSFFLSALPMMMSEGLFEDAKIFKRFKTLTSYNVSNILPLLGEWKGNGVPKLLLPGRRGQLAAWDPFVNPEGNYNISIVASSGRGKSTFTQEYMVSQLATGGQIWVIDVGRSYEKTAKLLGGVFLEFSESQPICLNPFSNIKNFEDDLEMLLLLFSTMMRPHHEASDEELAHLEKALKAVWIEHEHHSTVTQVAEHLQNNTNTTAKNIALLLYPYTLAGRYGRYFEGESTFDFNSRLVVLELEELKSKKDLQKIVLLLLMYRITQAMFLGDRSTEKSCIIDEAWDLLGDSNTSTARFIETGYRRARRYNANFVTLTQSINDYYKNPASLAAYENADWSIVLGQKNEAIVKAKENKQFYMDDFTERLLKSLKKTEQYSECLIKGPSGVSVHRIVFEPFSRILYSSKASEYERVRTLQAQGKSLSEAVSQVAIEVFGK